MIDLHTQPPFKLAAASQEEGFKLMDTMLLEGEAIFASFTAAQDFIIFTNRRIVIVKCAAKDKGGKQAFTFFAYKNVHCYCIELARADAHGGKLELSFGELGTLCFKFAEDFHLRAFNRLLSQYLG